MEYRKRTLEDLKNEATINGIKAETDRLSDEDEYSNLVDQKIRKEYSLSKELSIYRKRDTEPEAFKAFYDFVEECKREAKEEMERRESENE